MRRYVTDPRDLRILRVWASCTAQRERVKTRFDALGWNYKTSDRRRRAACTAIAAGLNAERDMVALTGACPHHRPVPLSCDSKRQAWKAPGMFRIQITGEAIGASDLVHACESQAIAERAAQALVGYLGSNRLPGHRQGVRVVDDEGRWIWRQTVSSAPERMN